MIAFCACKSDQEPQEPDGNHKVGDPYCEECLDIVIDGKRQNANGYELTSSPGETEVVLEFYATYDPLESSRIVAIDMETQLKHNTVTAELVTPCWWDNEKGVYMGAEPCDWVKGHYDRLNPVYHQYVKVTAPDMETEQRAVILLDRGTFLQHCCQIDFVKKAAKK